MTIKQLRDIVAFMDLKGYKEVDILNPGIMRFPEDSQCYLMTSNDGPRVVNTTTGAIQPITDYVSMRSV
jgi:hypothetical protein